MIVIDCVRYCSVVEVFHRAKERLALQKGENLCCYLESKKKPDLYAVNTNLKISRSFRDRVETGMYSASRF